MEELGDNYNSIGIIYDLGPWVTCYQSKKLSIFPLIFEPAGRGKNDILSDHNLLNEIPAFSLKLYYKEKS